MKKIIICILALFIISGCKKATTSSSNVTATQASPQEIYKSAIKEMLDKIYYCTFTISDGVNNSIIDYYKKDDKIVTIQKYYYQDEGKDRLSYSITDSDITYYLMEQANNTVKLEQFDSTNLSTSMFINYYNNEYYKILGISSDIVNDKIILTLKLTNNTADTQYWIEELTLNTKGYFSKQKITYYQDDSFNETISDTSTTKISNFNNKSLDDFNKAIDNIKEYDGISNEELLIKEPK